MANITDKTVKSKYPPKDTNVTWIDTSSKPYVSRSYINGSWEVVGGGVTDYNDIKNKPTINGVELDGNKTSSDLGVYSKPSGGIPESDLSSDVQSQLNKHFKGWYDSSSNLPANPVVGDYAYVKGAESTDPAAIYECTTAGTWSDSGRTVDTSNVQTFETGEQVNSVGIDDEPITGSDNIVKSGGIKTVIENITFNSGQKVKDVDIPEVEGVTTLVPQINNGIGDFQVEDENGNIIMRLFDGGIETKKFNSKDAIKSISVDTQNETLILTI